MEAKTKFAALAAFILILMTAAAAAFLFYSLNHPPDNPPNNPPAVATASPAPISPASATGAAEIYLRAADLVTTDCPANSNLTYPGYPPFGNDWEATEAHAWAQNRPGRELARQAISINTATWPDNPENHFLNNCRKLANELGDAALYEHQRGRDADAVDTLRDILHMADVVDANPSGALVNNLVGQGCRALAMDRLLVISSSITLVADGQKSNALSLSSTRQLIASLIHQPDAETRIGWIKKFDSSYVSSPSMDRLRETFRRVHAEEIFAAMSLACHVFYFEHQRWPGSPQELAVHLPGGLPKDPWGQGGQTFGYVLIKAGLPDGSDRPLLYDRSYRSASKDELFFRVDQPEYSFYNGDGSNQPTNKQKHDGQFRDVASWAPGPQITAGPTTRPLP